MKTFLPILLFIPLLSSCVLGRTNPYASIPCPVKVIKEIDTANRLVAEQVIKDPRLESCHTQAAIRLMELRQQDETLAEQFRGSTTEAQREKDFTQFCQTSKKYDHVKDIIKKATLSTLKAPASAKFSEFQVRRTDSKDNSSCKYVVDFYVDAQNSFGALLRSEHTVLLSYYKDKGLLMDAEFSKP